MSVDIMFENQTSVIARDLNLNLTKFLENGSLGREDAHLALLAAASSVEHSGLINKATAELKIMGFTDDQIREARESAAIMGMLNTYYKFRHFLGNGEDYRVAGLRMTALARPVLGKERFEMLAFTVSVLNGCEPCTKSHEKALRDAGVSSDKIHDLARIAAIVNGLRLLDNERG